jgi:O-antigen ligase
LPNQNGAAVIDLTATTVTQSRFTVADGLSDDIHHVEINVLPSQGSNTPVKATLQGVVVSREPLRAPGFLLLAGMLVIGLLCIRWIVLLAQRPPSLVARAETEWQKLDERVQAALVLLVGGAGIATACLSTDLRIAVLGGLVALIVIWLDMEAGPALLMFSLPFYLVPFQLVTTGDPIRPLFSPVEVLILLSVAVWITKYLLFPATRQKFHLHLGWNELAVLLFIVLGAIGVLVAAQPKESLREFRTIIIEPACVYFLLTTVVREKGLKRILSFFFIGAVIVSLIGLYQYVATTDVITAEGVRRMKVFYGSPNNLSLYLGRVIPLAACMALWSGTKRWHLVGLALMVIAQILTFSVGGWAGLLAAVLFIGVLKGRRALASTVGAIVVAVIAAIPLLRVERIASHLNFSEGTTALRLDIWEAGLAIGRDHPILGIGLDSFLAYYPKYMLPSAWREPNLSHPHNFLLDFWLRMGVAGLAVMLCLVISFFITAYRLFVSETRPWQKALLLGLMASMVDFVVHGMIDNSYFVVDLAVVFWFTIATVRILDRERKLA